MIIDFVKTSPAQNTTVLVTSVCPEEHYINIAKKVMGYEFLHAEQVGFIRAPKHKDTILFLEMSGGEFCGNATLSAAAYVKYKGLTNNNDFFLEVSGLANPIQCKTIKKRKFHYNVKCQMPSAQKVKEYKVKVDNQIIQGSIIKFDGITHFIFPVKSRFIHFTKVLDIVKKDIYASALGIIPYKTLGEQKYKIKPYIYVRKTGSNVFERGCGSGSLALGIYLNKNHKKQGCIKVLQPGGIIEVEIGKNLYISTDVLVTCEGRILI